MFLDTMIPRPSPSLIAAEIGHEVPECVEEGLIPSYNTEFSCDICRERHEVFAVGGGEETGG